MPKEKCLNCPELKRCRESRASLIFFIVGMVATVAVRVVTVLSQIKPAYGQAAWYIGVLGFFVFFIYKFRVEQKRQKVIVDSDLMRKISCGGNLREDDRLILSAMLCAMSSNKDRINYFFIFITSALAIIAAVYFDFFR